MRAWQAGLKEIPPYVEAELPDGTWQRIAGRCGISRWPRANDRRRPDGQAAGGNAAHPVDDESANLLGPGADRPEHGRADAHDGGSARISATLHFRGYPKQIEGASPGDLDYDYNLVSLSGPFQRERGDYTHFGDVTPLLKEH